MNAIRTLLICLLSIAALVASPHATRASDDPAGPPLQFTAQFVAGGSGGEDRVALSWVTPHLDIDQLPTFQVARRDLTDGGSSVVIIGTQVESATDPVRALPGPNCHSQGDGLCAQPGHTYGYTVRMDYVADSCFGLTTYSSRYTTEIVVSIPGGEPRLEVLPATLDFGEVATGSTAESSLRVRNTSGGTVVVTPSRPAKPFSLADAKPFVLLTGESKFVTLRAAPTKVRTYSGAVRFSTDTLPTAEAALTVTAVPPIDVSRTEIDFGSVRGLAADTITITNRRSTPVRVRLGGLRAPFSVDAPHSLTLAPLGSAVVTIRVATGYRTETRDFLTITALPGADSTAVELKVRNTEKNAILNSTVGDVYVRHSPDGPRELVGAGTVVSEGDTVETDLDAEATLVFADGTLMVVKELSQILVMDLLSTQSRQNMRMQLKIGEVAATVNPQKTFKSDFRVTTPGATTSVRGTEFDTAYDPETGTTTVRVREGIVQVAPTNRKLRPAKVRAGQQIVVTDTAIGPIEPYVPE